MRLDVSSLISKFPKLGRTVFAYKVCVLLFFSTTNGIDEREDGAVARGRVCCWFGTYKGAAHAIVQCSGGCKSPSPSPLSCRRRRRRHVYPLSLLLLLLLF